MSNFPKWVFPPSLRANVLVRTKKPLLHSFHPACRPSQPSSSLHARARTQELLQTLLRQGRAPFSTSSKRTASSRPGVHETLARFFSNIASRVRRQPFAKHQRQYHRKACPQWSTRFSGYGGRRGFHSRRLHHYKRHCKVVNRQIARGWCIFKQRHLGEHRAIHAVAEHPTYRGWCKHGANMDPEDIIRLAYTRTVPTPAVFTSQISQLHKLPVNAISRRPTAQPQAPHLLHAAVQHASLGIRAFSSSARCSMPVPLLLLAKPASALLTVLKSSTALKTVSTVARIMLSLFPLSVRSRIVHLHRATAPSFFNSAGLMYSLVLLPIALLAGAIAANYQATPISGRKRIMMLSPAEEQMVVDAFAAETTVGQIDAPDCLHWVRSRCCFRINVYSCPPASQYHILRNVFGEADAANGTLLGAKVIVPGSDWRLDWVESTLRHIESGLTKLSNTTGEQSLHGLDIPSLDHPLPLGHAPPNYAVLLVDRPEINAFSFGWAPHTDMHGVSPGVIVVFTGFLDFVLGKNDSIDDTRAVKTASATPAEECSMPNLPKPFLPFKQLQKVQLDSSFSAQPTAEQTRALAVLLSHELSHLLLGHTMETYAKANLLWPQIRRIFVDGQLYFYV